MSSLLCRRNLTHLAKCASVGLALMTLTFALRSVMVGTQLMCDNEAANDFIGELSFKGLVF